VLSAGIDTWTLPLTDYSLRFAGKVVLLVGAGAWSSAVLFAIPDDDGACSQ
jgi:hypothetical protein